MGRTPPRDAALAATSDVMAGQQIFERIGCSTCQVESMQTLAAGTVVDGGTFTLWGLRMKSRYMHDLKSLSLESAIRRHDGEAEQASRGFRRLSDEERKQLLVFLNSL